jgi:hypothetical protein
MIKDGLELLQKYGAKNLFFIAAIVYLYLATLKNEAKIEKIEAKLYDCYEDRVLIQRNANNTFQIPKRLIAILPNEKNNIRYTRTQRKV